MTDEHEHREASDGFISVHTDERYLAIGHPDQRARSYGPYRTEEEAHADDVAHPCECHVTIVGIRFPPGFIPVQFLGIVIDTGEELKPEPPVDGQN